MVFPVNEPGLLATVTFVKEARDATGELTDLDHNFYILDVFPTPPVWGITDPFTAKVVYGSQLGLPNPPLFLGNSPQDALNRAIDSLANLAANQYLKRLVSLPT